jgi:Ca2+-binding RTX toxin-like protein
MRTFLLAILATLLLAAPASAARFQKNAADIDFTVAPTDVVNLAAGGDDPGGIKQLAFTRATGATAFTTGTGCTLLNGIARCSVTTGTRLRFTTAERADAIDASGTATPEDASVPEVFDTKGGDDVLTAGPLEDVVNAGIGNDTIAGGPDADQLHGDAGDDVFTDLTSGDLVDGGPGEDVLDLTGEPSGVSVSLNGIADDGGALGGDANVIAVESLRGSPSGDFLSGGGAADRLEGGDGDDTIDALGGGGDVVDCGPGDADLARADAGDQVVNCEQVELPPPPAGGGAEAALPVAAVAVDLDRDGAVAGADCDDTRAAVRPGARDIAGNGVDEDCAGGDAARALAGGRLSFEFLAFPNGTTKAAKLLVRDLARGGRAELRCIGRPCSFRKRVGKADRSGAVNLRKLLKRRLKAGAVLEVRLTAPNAIGRVIRFRMRKGRLPKRSNLCLPPGAATPGRCT